LNLRGSYPITIHSSYDSPFDELEKTRRQNEVLSGFLGQWVLVVDSDELVEFPHSFVRNTIRDLEHSGVTCIAAPMLQRLRREGSLESPDVVRDVFREFPICSERLYYLMGSRGLIAKYPLFRCGPETVLQKGSHLPPIGASVSDAFQAVTHHFKWKRSAIKRISYMIEVGWPCAEKEAVPYLNHLSSHNFRLPLEDAFTYSRRELFRRGLLRRPAPTTADQFSSWPERLRHGAKELLQEILPPRLVW
jgi:hypothetical protein